MSVVYLQCDMRYNNWLLSSIGDKTVIEHTIEKCREFGSEKIVAGIYSCYENTRLIDMLKKVDVEVVVSEEDDVNKRFLDIVTSQNTDYIIRVGGDQPLVDSKLVRKIITEMKEQSAEWFYEKYLNCIIPDIVSVECLKKNSEYMRLENRYFVWLERQEYMGRYNLPYPVLLMFNFRANSNEGYRVCKNVITNKLDIYEISKSLLNRLLINNDLIRTGIWSSWLIPHNCAEFFYDGDNEINPWWGRGVIDFLKPHLNKQLSVFEWGSGNSTLFLSKYTKDVVSTEHDQKWFEKMKDIVPENVQINHFDLQYNGQYCKAILDSEKKYDIVLIDGRDRVRCAKNAVQRLKEDGIIIWDNSDRDRYNEGYIFLKENGFKELKFSGVVYKIPGKISVTSIFYRTQNFLNL